MPELNKKDVVSTLETSSEVTTQTLAEQHAESIAAGDYDAAGAMFYSQHHVTSGQLDYVLEFEDGSLHDESTEETYDTKADYLLTVSSINEMDAEIELEGGPHHPLTNSDGWVEVTGIIEEDPTAYCFNLPLKITNMTRNGKTYTLGSSDYKEEDTDEASIGFTSELATLIGKKVTVRAGIGHYTEIRYGARGGEFYPDVEYLFAPTVVNVHEIGLPK